MIEADSVMQLKDRWDKSITAAEAGSMLGIGRIAVAGLVRSNCLTAVQGPSVTKQLEWKFEAGEVERLLREIEGKIDDKKRLDGAHQVTFHKAIQKLSKLSIEVGSFVKLILDGKITPAGKGDGTGIAAILFDAGEIGKFSRMEAVKRRAGKHTMQEAARLLNIPNSKISFLVERRLLIAENATAAGRGGTWSITREEIARFKATYSTVGQMLHVFCTSAKGLSDRLIANGVMPVTGPKIDGGSLYFFKKADLEAVDLAKILPKTKDNTLQKMNERGLVTKRQLADIAGYTLDQIDQIIRSGRIVPALTKPQKNKKGVRVFFSDAQVEEFKKIKAAEDDHIALSNSVKMGGLAA